MGKNILVSRWRYNAAYVNGRLAARGCIIIASSERRTTEKEIKRARNEYLLRMKFSKCVLYLICFRFSFPRPKRVLGHFEVLLRTPRCIVVNIYINVRMSSVVRSVNRVRNIHLCCGVFRRATNGRRKTQVFWDNGLARARAVLLEYEIFIDCNHLTGPNARTFADHVNQLLLHRWKS